MQNSRYDSSTTNFSINVKYYSYFNEFKNESYPISENLCLKLECKTARKSNITDPEHCDTMVKSVCYLMTLSTSKTFIVSVIFEWKGTKQWTRSSMVTGKRLIYLLTIGVWMSDVEVAKVTDTEWSLTMKFRLWMNLMWQFIYTSLCISYRANILCHGIR
jgi:hypothetical protein